MNVTLYDKRELANVIKLKIFEMDNVTPGVGNVFSAQGK